MSQPKKKKIKLHLPSSFEHKCNTKNMEDYMPIANLEPISIENQLMREGRKQGVELAE